MVPSPPMRAGIEFQANLRVEGHGAVVGADVVVRAEELDDRVDDADVADARDTKTNAAAVSAVVDHHLHGATVWGETINQQKIIMIMWGFLVVALNAIIELLGANYNVRSDDRAVSFDA